MQFRILGPVEAVSSQGVTSLGSGRQSKLLTMLLINFGRAVSRERLTYAIWDRPPLTAPRQLHNAVAALRRELAELGAPPGLIVTESIGYRIVIEPHQLDAEIFARNVREAERDQERGDHATAAKLLQGALQLWRGPAFSGVEGQALDVVATELTENRLSAIERLARLRLEMGDPATAVKELTSVVAEHPLRESLRHNFILALYRAGRQSDAIFSFEAARHMLSDELGVDPGIELRRLHERILRSDPTLLSPIPLVDAARPAPTDPAPSAAVSPVVIKRSTLPYSTADFTGRSNELQRVLETAQPEQRATTTILAITGMPGVGKTALAVHAAHRLIEQQLDEYLFVDLHGFTPGRNPLSAGEALRFLLGSIGVLERDIPADLDARAAMWRSQAACKKILLVLDNVASTAQVRPLLPATPGSIVLLTSRRLLSLDGVISLPVDPLQRSDAVELFTRIVGPGRVAGVPAVDDVLEQCAHLPLAIRIAASRLKHHASWTVKHLADRLRRPAGIISELSFADQQIARVFYMSYARLTDEQQKLFMLLGLFSSEEFGADQVAEEHNRFLSEAETALEELFEQNMIQLATSGRYYMNHLLREYAAELSEGRL